MKDLAILDFNAENITSEQKEIIMSRYSSNDGLSSIVDEAREHVNGFDHNVETAVGRKRSISLAAKISKLKVRLDEIGKDLVADHKKKTAAVDKSRREMRKEFDEIRDAARLPVTEWELEQERIAEESRIKSEAEELAKAIADNHEIAILMDREFDRNKNDREEKEAAEKEEIRLREEEAVAKRDEAIRIEAAEEAEREKEAALAKAAQAEAAAEAAEKRRIESEKQSAIDAKIAKEQAEAAAKKAAAEASLFAISEQKRLAKEKEDRDAADREQRESNKRNVGTKRKQAKEDLMKVCGISESDAKKVILAINSKSIRNIEIKY